MRPSFFILSSQYDSTMRILSDTIDRISSSVPSSDWPTLTMNSSTMGRADRMASTTGKSNLTAFRQIVNPLIFIFYITVNVCPLGPLVPFGPLTDITDSTDKTDSTVSPTQL